MRVETIYDLITNVLLCHISHVSNGNICGMDHILCECI